MKARPSRLSRVRLTLAQVAQRLGCSVREARALVVAGPIDGIKVGDQVVAELGAVEQYLRQAA